jgi:hypothetical protein
MALKGKAQRTGTLRRKVKRELRRRWRCSRKHRSLRWTPVYHPFVWIPFELTWWSVTFVFDMTVFNQWVDGVYIPPWCWWFGGMLLALHEMVGRAATYRLRSEDCGPARGGATGG